MERWATAVAATRETFLSGLVRAGLRLLEDRSDGARSDATLRDERITVSLVDGFPYIPPKVRPNRPEPSSWHRERDGHLCLYAPHDHNGQPWLDPQAFLRRIGDWFERNAAGWPDDPPALDLEAYLNLPVDERFVLHDGLSARVAGYVQLRADEHQIEIVGGGKVPKKSRKGRLSGYVTDLGQLDGPPSSWDELLTWLPESVQIRTAIRRNRLDVLLLRYHRGPSEGVLAITLRPTKPGRAPQPHLAFSGATGETAIRLRSGISSAGLEDKHVYLVGVGALGSHIADNLSRAGIGRLTLRDDDIFRPGNATRHLLTTAALAGFRKAAAVATLLGTRPYNRAEITPITEALVRPDEAATLLLGDALVVDATADDSVTCMLEDAAVQLGRRFITACVQNEGRTLRVDIVPPLNENQPQKPTDPLPPRAPEVFDAGCAAPISGTPPHAVTEAAAMATRHIIGLLTGQASDDAGEIRELP